MTKEKFLEKLPAIRKAAHDLGYAVAVHGTLARDFDIVAVAWVDGAASADDLARAIYHAAGGVCWRVWWNEGNPKPFGRKAYAFDWDAKNYENSGYCDLSVIPPTGDK